MAIVSRKPKIIEQHHRTHRTVNFSKILDYYLPITHDHALFPTPKWFEKQSNKLAVIIPIHNNVDAFINAYERSELASIDAEFIFVDNNSTNAPQSLIRYFNESQTSMGRIVMCLQKYSFYDCCKIGSNYTQSPNLLFLNPYTMIQNGIVECLELLDVHTMVSPCLVKENGRVFSAGRMWKNEFIDIGNEPSLSLPDMYASLEKTTNVVQALRPFACFIRKKCFDQLKNIHNSFDDLCLSLQRVLVANEFMAIIDGACKFEDTVEVDDIFFNKWVASNRLGEYQKIRGILIKKEDSLQEVVKLIPLLKRKYPNTKIFSLKNSNSIFDRNFDAIQECERLCQFVINLDALHQDDIEVFKIYLGLIS